MKNFRDYLKESEQAADTPVAGDTFAINIREECLIESVVVESRDDGVVIAADEHMMQLLESYGYTFEENCMECGMNEGDCGCDHEQVDEIAPVLGAIARTAIPMAVGAAMSDDETNETRDPGEYDEEGDMAKNELYTMIRSARKLIGMLDNDDNMPEWTQKKINKATDYVDTAADYISSQKERGVMEQGAALPDIRGLGPDAQALILKLRRDVEDKRLQPTPQAVLAAARELAGDLEFAPLLLVQQVLGNAKGIAEGDREPSPVARATLHRIMMRHPGMLAQHGPERVMQAVDDVADLVGDMDDIGSSDVSGWVNMVQEILDSQDQDQNELEEGPVGGEIDDTRMNDQHKEFYKKNPHFKRNNRDRVDVGHGTQLATRVDPAKTSQVQRKPITPFGLKEEATMASVSKLLRHIERHHPTWFDDYGMGEVEDTVVDMAEQGQFSGMTVVDAAALVSQELESLYGANGMNEAEYQGHAKFHTKTNKQVGPTHYGRGSDKKADSYTKADPRYHEVRPVKEQGVAEAVWDRPSQSYVPRDGRVFGQTNHPREEHCDACGAATGHAGPGEDSNVDDNGNVYCDDCYAGEQGVTEGNMDEAEYQGRKVPLGKPMKGDVAKSKVYVKDPKTGNVKKVNFGDPNMKIKKSNPARRKSFRARHNCDNPGPRTKARYWSCRAW